MQLSHLQTLQDASPPKKTAKQEPPRGVFNGLKQQEVYGIVFSAPRGSISVLVWALDGIGLPEFLLLLLITPHHSELEQKQPGKQES